MFMISGTTELQCFTGNSLACHKNCCCQRPKQVEKMHRLNGPKPRWRHFFPAMHWDLHGFAAIVRMLMNLWPNKKSNDSLRLQARLRWVAHLTWRTMRNQAKFLPLISVWRLCPCLFQRKLFPQWISLARCLPLVCRMTLCHSWRL